MLDPGRWFLLCAVVGVLFTLNAIWPHRRFWLIQGPAFFASWTTSELARHVLFVQVAVTAAFVATGAGSGPLGGVSMALAGMSWAGLAALIVESTRAARVLERALSDSLGDGYRSSIAPDLARHVDEPSPLRQALFPFSARDPRVERVGDVTFSRPAGRALRLDIYRNRRRPKRCPTLLFIHGGAWVLGRKEDQGLPLMTRLAAHGWVCISADYRLSPRATFPEHLIDVKAAITWVREHGAAYGADPEFLVLSGGSAGGHLAALAALTPGDPEYQPGFEDADTRVQACVPLYGVYDFTDRKRHWRRSLLLRLLENQILKKRRELDPAAFERASPMSRVNADAPPFLVVHGTRDTLVPVAEARTFVELLRAVSREPVVYAELPGAQHAFEVFSSQRTSHTIRGIERFVDWVYSRYLEAARQGS